MRRIRPVRNIASLREVLPNETSQRLCERRTDLRASIVRRVRANLTAVFRREGIEDYAIEPRTMPV